MILMMLVPMPNGFCDVCFSGVLNTKYESLMCLPIYVHDTFVLCIERERFCLFFALR